MSPRGGRGGGLQITESPIATVTNLLGVLKAIINIFFPRLNIVLCSYIVLRSRLTNESRPVSCTVVKPRRTRR